MSRIACVVLALGVAGCGTLASGAGGDTDLPRGRSGPFRLLDNLELPAGSCVLRDDTATLGDPSAVALPDGRIDLYATRTDGTARSIVRARLDGSRSAPGAPAMALVPTLPWHGGGVGAPDVVRTADGAWMVFDTAAGIGLARSVDGIAWTSLDAPLLVADATAGELSALRAPTLAVRADGTWWLAYESAGAIWGARATGPQGPFVRVDGDDRTARRDPWVSPGDDAVDAGVVGYASGSVGDPSLRVEASVAGRELLRLYFSARSAPVAMDGGTTFLRSVGLAGSFDGVHFTRNATAVLPGALDPTVSSPTSWNDGALRTWLFVGGRCDLSGRSSGVRVAVAPANQRYDRAP